MLSLSMSRLKISNKIDKKDTVMNPRAGQRFIGADEIQSFFSSCFLSLGAEKARDLRKEMIT